MEKRDFVIHPLSDVQTNKIGSKTFIWQYAVILKGAVIGDNCNINCHTFIENDVVIGNNVTVKAGVYLWDGIAVEDNVFIGPNVTFTNVKYPRSKIYPENFQRILLKEGCSIGANATILGGITIGEYSIVAAGSIVTKDVAPFTLVKGSPAAYSANIDKQGNKV
jgi:UDP-2-acetamido-3-amino-2,3-dideoxy-glucuronate N-acetyltransferase